MEMGSELDRAVAARDELTTNKNGLYYNMLTLHTSGIVARKAADAAFLLHHKDKVNDIQLVKLTEVADQFTSEEYKDSMEHFSIRAGGALVICPNLAKYSDLFVKFEGIRTGSSQWVLKKHEPQLEHIKAVLGVKEAALTAAAHRVTLHSASKAEQVLKDSQNQDASSIREALSHIKFVSPEDMHLLQEVGGTYAHEKYQEHVDCGNVMLDKFTDEATATGSGFHFVRGNKTSSYRINHLVSSVK